MEKLLCTRVGLPGSLRRFGARGWGVRLQEDPADGGSSVQDGFSKSHAVTREGSVRVSRRQGQEAVNGGL